MHWVTKVFIVGAAVLSVLLAALVMAYSVNVKEIRDEHANLVASRNEAAASLGNQSTQFGAERVKFTDTITSKENDLAMMRQQISQLQTENSALRTDKSRAEANFESVTQKIQQLSETNKTLTTLVQNQLEEVKGLRGAEMTFRRREIELVDRNNDLEAQKEVLIAQSRALDEQVHELRGAFEAMKIGGIPGGEGEVPRAINSFKGRIIEVSRDASSGDLLAEINLGTNDGVKEKMELWLARDSTLLGKLTVIKTDLRSSVGRVDTLGIKDPKGGRAYSIQPEDQVYSSVFR